MKVTFIALVTLSLTTLFATETKVALPDQLNCQATYCIFGEGSFCDVKEYQKIELRNLNSHPQWVENDLSGRVNIQSETDKVILDFTDGDQYSLFTFIKVDIGKLLKGQENTLPGTYEDAFDWTDGYHTRALMALKCTL